MSTSERNKALLKALGGKLKALSEACMRQHLEKETGLSRPTLLAAERGEDVQLSTLLRILEAHGQLHKFESFVLSLGESADATGVRHIA
jgi:transcriptional regulator with XRE-family HTH domain